MEQNQQSNFLGSEKISKLILKFSIPCVLSLLVSALYNFFDQIFIGRSELSTLGNAATGVVFPIFVIAQAFAWCFGDGCAAYLNICQGKNDSQNAHKAIGTGITLTLISSLVLMAIFIPLKNSILTIFGASEASLGYAIEYFNWIIVFFPLYMLSNMFNSVIRADGAPGWSMVSMLVGAIINIILDPIFIFGCKWGMSGAAIATVIGQVASFIISFIYIFKTKTFKLSLKSLIPNFKEFKGALLLGISSFITQLTIVIISIVCNIMLKKYGALSKYGEDIPIAIISVETKVFTIVINLVVGIVLGSQPIASYNMGARHYDRVKELYKKVLFCTVCIGIFFTLLFQIFPDAVVGVFGEASVDTNTLMKLFGDNYDPINSVKEFTNLYREFGEMTFRIFLMLITFTCFTKMTSIFFQAVGKPVRAVISSLVRDIICFIPLIIILPIFFNIKGILFAAPVADFISMIIAVSLTILFLKSLKKTPKDDYSDVILKPSKPGVIVTIAREHGTLGKEIGRIVAEKLNIPFYYKEMTALAAQESGLDKEFISDINDNAPDMLHSLYLSTNVVQHAIKAQDQIIRKIADNGSCVIVGRAADYVLRDYDNVIKIFISAPMDYKVENVMNVYNDSKEEALKHITHSDNARANYYKNISGNNWNDSNNYNLCLDASIGTYNCVNIILSYINAKK